MIAPTDDESVLALVGAALPDVAAATMVARRFADQRTALARKALWVIDQVAPDRVSNDIARIHFQDQWLGAEAEFVVWAAAASAGHGLQFTGATERTLVVAWHMPEWPLLVRPIREARAVALVASDAQWIRSIGGDALLNFREAGAAPALVRAFRQGRPVVAMLDYCYDETASVLAPFMGRPTRTPAGLFVLARRYGYGVSAVSVEGGQTLVTSCLTPAEAADLDASAMATVVNRSIERAVFRDPPRWLLWPALDRRWRGDGPLAAHAPSGRNPRDPDRPGIQNRDP